MLIFFYYYKVLWRVNAFQVPEQLTDKFSVLGWEKCCHSIND